MTHSTGSGQAHRPTTADVIAWFKDERAKREVAEARCAALEADLRAAVAALEWQLATTKQYYLVSGYRASLGYSRQDFDDAEDGLKQAMANVDAVLSLPGVAALREDANDG